MPRRDRPGLTNNFNYQRVLRKVVDGMSLDELRRTEERGLFILSFAVKEGLAEYVREQESYNASGVILTVAGKSFLESQN